MVQSPSPTILRMSSVLALRIPADGSEPQLVTVDLTSRPDDDGQADFFDPVPNLIPWLGLSAFKKRRSSDFYVGDFEKTGHLGGFIKSDDQALYGHYILYYTIISSLPINQNCLGYVEFKSSEDRLFWRGDMFVVRYEGELGIGHQFMDTSLALAPIICESIRVAYSRSALERIVASDAEFYHAQEEDRKSH